MNRSERLEYRRLITDGWKVYRNGWPDFLAEKDGKFRFIEVKTARSPHLSPGQKRMIHALYRMTKIHTEVRLYQK